ncbi:hypothetical protein C8J57DRAFT_1282666 [Mycena rebaudengoi]|nr:hypothetical protein C8J57DRAFT_1282666 [Mycena rebaudengoi]
MTYLHDLPPDLIFYLLSKLPLRDAWSLSMVCRALKNLSTDRSFWMAAIKADPHMCSLSCPWTFDDQMDLARFKQLVLHSIRLDYNWSLAHPQIMGDVARRSDIGFLSVIETNHLFRFPGSELFLFYSDKQLKSFNFATGEQVALLDLGAYVRAASYELLPSKAVLLGLALQTGLNIPVLLFIQIVELNANITATILLQSTLPTKSDCHKPFLSPQIVGAIQAHSGHTEIVAFNLASGKSTTITTDIPVNYATSRRLVFSFLCDNLYLLADDGPGACIYCCPKDLLPYGTNPPAFLDFSFGDIDPIPLRTKVWRRRGPVCFPMFHNAHFVRFHDALGFNPNSEFLTTFRFWRSHSPSEISLPGMCPGERTTQVALSGYCAVAALLAGECRLHLIRYLPDKDICSAHELELPTGVGGRAPPPTVLAVDDHRGVIWLVTSGEMMAVSYA